MGFLKVLNEACRNLFFNMMFCLIFLFGRCNTASQIINQEFIENFSTFTAQNYPFALTNNANYSQPTVQNRLGVCAIQSASNTPTYIATTSQWTPVMINSSSTGLGITFIVSPFNGNFTSGNTKIWVGMNVSYTGFALTSNNCACFWLDQTVSNTWGCRIGDSPITYFAAPNVADWLVLRMYPDSSGNGIYFNYYNQTTSTSAGTAYIPYTSQGPTTNVSNTTPMYVGFGILSSIASQRFIYADYMGVQSAINRIYS